MHSFEDYNPLVLLLYYLTVAVLAFFCKSLIIAGLFLLAAMLHFSLRPGKNKLKSNIFYISFGIILALLNPLFNHMGSSILFFMNDNPVTLEALIYGIYSATMIVAILYLFRVFSQIMTSDRIIYMLGKISGRAAVIFSMTLRYIPLLRSYAAESKTAGTALGLCSEDGIFDKIKSRLNIYSIVMTRSLENGIITADSMTARGYGTGKRSSFSPIRFRISDLLFLLLTLALSGVIIAGILSDAVSADFYPEYILPERSLLSVISVISAAVLAFLPLSAELIAKAVINHRINSRFRSSSKDAD